MNEHEVRDPVCGMSILPSAAAGHVEHHGETYHFCSDSCVEKFRKNPASFLAPGPSSPGEPIGRA